MNLQLTKPLVFFDLETTSADVNTARIVEIGAVRLNFDGTRDYLHRRYNPGIPIPPEASAVHGIYDIDVADAISFDEGAGEILEFFDDVDIAGYNSNRFDNVILASHLEEQGYDFITAEMNSVDVLNIHAIKEDRKLATVYKFHTGKVLENAHNAIADIEATIEIFESQLERYPDLPRTVEGLAVFSNYGKLPPLDRENKFVYNDRGVVSFNFGKYNGLPCAEHHDYLDWVELLSSMSDHVKTIAGLIKRGGFPDKKV